MTIVTALFGTVRTRLTDSPRYSDRHPSLCTIVFAVLMIPGTFGRMWFVGDDLSISCLCVCSRVRRTSWGYVAIDAVIFATAEQPRNSLGVSFSGAPLPTTSVYQDRLTKRRRERVLTGPAFEELVERELNGNVSYPEQTRKESPEERSPAFCSINCGRCIQRVPIARLVSRLCLDGGELFDHVK